MSKIGYTKNRILNILANQSKTPTEISEELGLDLSTVSQHLKELKGMGAIEELRSEHFKKWKSYKLNPAFDYNSLAIDKTTQNLRDMRDKALFGITLFLILGGLLYYHFATPSAKPTSRFVQIALTDPPTVPQGTQALYINYYFASVHVTGNGTSEWIQTPVIINNSGTLNLLALTNASQVIGNLRIPTGDHIDAVGFDMPSAQILINGTLHNVVLRSSQVTSAVSGNDTAKGDEVLVELEPTVVPMYINGITAFVMLPQIDSVLVNSTTSTGSVGSTVNLTPSQLRGLLLLQSNLSLSNTTISIVNGNVSLRLTVSNPSKNGDVVLRDMLLLGNQSLFDGTEISGPHPAVPVTRGHTGVEFLVQDNGSLTFANQQYVESSLVRNVNFTYTEALSGYTLAPNQSVTLSYVGTLPLADNLSILLTKGDTYKISVLGDYIHKLSTNVTAT